MPPRAAALPSFASPRLSRAALILAGAAAVSSAACGKTTDTGSTTSSGSIDRGPAPAYGGPPPSFLDATVSTTPVPPPDAAAVATDAGKATDAGPATSRDR